LTYPEGTTSSVTRQEESVYELEAGKPRSLQASLSFGPGCVQEFGRRNGHRTG
jgi:hypothetical protein